MPYVLPESMDPTTANLDITRSSRNAGEELPMLQEWAYDFEKNEFKTDKNGLPYLVQGDEALKIWLFWAVLTERYKYSANSDLYGSEINNMIGLPISKAIKSSELVRTIRESIEICPYVKRVEHVNVTADGDTVYADVKVQSKYNEGWVETHVKI